MPTRSPVDVIGTALPVTGHHGCRRRFALLATVVWGAAVVAVLARSLASTLPQLRRLPAPNGWLLALAAAAIALSYLSTAIGLRAAAGAQLPLRRTVLVQLAAAATNRVVPGGAGGAAVNARYLIRSGLPVPVAGVAVAAVALANGLASLLLFLLSGPGAATALQRLTGRVPWLPTALAAALMLALITLIAARRRLPAVIRSRGRRWYEDGHEALVALGRDRRRLVTVLAGSVGVKVAHVLALLAALSAFGSHLRVLLVVAIYLGSAAAAAAIPTPGGLGSVEAILVASLVAVGGAAAAMLAAVLTFRALSFWLPIAPGVVATWTLRRRQAL